MRCYYHNDREAVGSCKSCGKGLCSECAVDLAKGLACRGRCEEDVRAVIQLVERNIKMEPTSSRIIQASGSARLATSLFCLVSGAAFLTFGLREGLDFATIIGGCLIAYGLYTVWWSQKITSQAKRS